MVENTVQNNLHAPAVHLIAEVGKIGVTGIEIENRGHPFDIAGRIAVMLLPALHGMVHVILDHGKMGVNMVIVLHVILMAGGRNEDGVEVDHLNTETLQIIQLLAYPLQVTPVKDPDVGIRHGIIPVLGMLGVADHIIILIVLHIIGGVPVAEAVHHDLILHGTLCPGRGVETGREGKGNAGVRLFTLGQNMGTGLLKGDAETAGLHNKGIGHLVGKAHQFRHIVVVIRIGRILAHEDSHFRLTDIE